jgi:hypothetical protein
VCADGRQFHALRDARKATVRVEQEVYQLTAKKSSIGDRYTNEHATLIIDQGFAAFVRDGDEELTTCQLQSE